jgi:hypothetical protein
MQRAIGFLLKGEFQQCFSAYPPLLFLGLSLVVIIVLRSADYTSFKRIEKQVYWLNLGVIAVNYTLKIWSSV